MVENWVADERRGLADVLEGLTPEQWETPSLCDGWTVRCVVAHMTMPFRYSTPRFLLELARSGGRFNRMADRVARRDAAMPTADLALALRDNAENPWKPPGADDGAVLTHDVVHGIDITRPLGIDQQVPSAAMTVVLDTLVTAASLRHFGTDIDGLALRATDITWSHGSGEVLAGSGVDLALLLTGRVVAAGSFAGAGAERIEGAVA